jgi:hypothetical protein
MSACVVVLPSLWEAELVECRVDADLAQFGGCQWWPWLTGRCQPFSGSLEGSVAVSCCQLRSCA